MDLNKDSKKMDLAELDTVAGGAVFDRIHDLNCFIVRTVCNVVHYDDTTSLTMRYEPGGDIVQGVGWQNGEQILVHGQYSEGRWSFAYKNGQFGYVDSNYVC